MLRLKSKQEFWNQVFANLVMHIFAHMHIMKGLQLRWCHLDFGDVIYYQSENYLFSNKTESVQ